MRFHDVVRATAVGALILPIWPASTASGQSNLGANEGFGDRPRIGIGYVSNAPNMFAGGSAYFLGNLFGGLGFYVDGKVSTSSPSEEPDFLETMTAAEAEETEGQFWDRDGYDWWSVNAALMRPITPELMIYLGAGLTQQEAYQRYRDPADVLELGTGGWYWVRDEELSGGLVNYVGGAFFRMSQHLALQFGLESAPRGITVGGSLSMPLR